MDLCGLVNLLILCLYINCPGVLRLYRRPEVLWPVCPVLLYWIGRVWFLARRQEMAHDPISFALRDRIGYLAGLLAAAIIVVDAVGSPAAPWRPQRPIPEPGTTTGSLFRRGSLTDTHCDGRTAKDSDARKPHEAHA